MTKGFRELSTPSRDHNCHAWALFGLWRLQLLLLQPRIQSKKSGTIRFEKPIIFDENEVVQSSVFEGSIGPLSRNT